MEKDTRTLVDGGEFRVTLHTKRPKKDDSDEQPSYRLEVRTATGGYPARHLRPGDDTAPRALRHLPTIELSRESRFDRVCKALRLVPEVQVGDEAFDREVFIESMADDDFVRSLLTGVAGDVRALLAGRDAKVELFGAGHLMSLEVKGAKDTPIADPGDEELQRSLRVAAALPSITAEETSAEMNRSEVLGPLCFLAGIFMAGWGLLSSDDSYQVVTGNPVLTVAASLGAALLLLIPVMAGFSNSGRNYLMAAGMLGIGVLCGGMRTAYALNAWFAPDTEPIAIETDVLATERTSNLFLSNTVDVALPGVPGAGATSMLYVDYDAWSRLAKVRDAKLRCTVREGAFGWYWVDDLPEE